MDLEKLEWKDIATDGYPKENERIIVDTRYICTGYVQYDNSMPPKAKFVFDKQHILKDTRYSYITEDEMEQITKEYL